MPVLPANGPGFQGSDKSGCEIIFYCHGNDPIFSTLKGRHILSNNPSFGKRPSVGSLQNAIGASAVTNLSWTKTIGNPSGTLSLSIHAHDSNADVLLRGIMDDDWFDLVLTQHDRKYHIARGFVDSVRKPIGVDNGATDVSISISGRDHGKVWEVTPVFFNRFVGEGASGASLIDRFSNEKLLFGNVEATVRGYLLATLDELNGNASARWRLPPGLPGAASQALLGDSFFRDHIRFVADGYTNHPARNSFGSAFLDPNVWSGTTLWNLAKEWSDPYFCEMFTELVNKDTGLPPRPGEVLTPEQSAMALILRDKPFPTTSARNRAGQDLTISEHPWFSSLPEYTVYRQELVNEDTGKGGDERFNTFFLRSPNGDKSLQQEIVKQRWWRSDVERRGIRPLNATTNYVEPTSGGPIMVETLQRQLVDWYGLNPYFYNGTISLGHLRPDIRIGSKIRIPGASAEDDSVYYVEGLTHNWSLGSGKTTLTVTRGWKGSDRSLMSAIQTMANQYSQPGDEVLDGDFLGDGTA